MTGKKKAREGMRMLRMNRMLTAGLESYSLTCEVVQEVDLIGA